MNKKKTLIGATLVVALLGIGTASAHFAGGGWGGSERFAEICPDDITVGECRQNIQAEREAIRLERCTEQYDAEFCQALIDLKEEHKDELKAYWDESGYNRSDFQKPDERPETAEERLAACSASFDEEFCQGLADLHAEHKAEVEALFDEYGYEKPERPDDRPGHPRRGPGSERH